ncbi:hypothetical protein B0H10DRAFT_660808 [Mycena sp. CBHHK59/15]|nr:hypothetical protein B0H10DRAFT_660808 [Mycena sp. CBHHK59/15]
MAPDNGLDAPPAQAQGGSTNGNTIINGNARASGSGSGMPLTLQQQQQLASLLNFKPSSRDVISGIAPHVFDDRRPRHRRRSTSPDVRRRSASPDVGRPERPHARQASKSCAVIGSPLRVAAVISIDEDGVVVQSHLNRTRSRTRSCTPDSNARAAAPAPLPLPAPLPPPLDAVHIKSKSKRSSFRIVLRTLVLRLK